MEVKVRPSLSSTDADPEREIDQNREREKENKILVLIDWENLQRNVKLPPPEKFSMKRGFNRLLKQLSEIGKVAMVFVFIPSHMASLYGKIFYEIEAGLRVILCPRIKTKEGKEKDTVDEILMEVGREMIWQIPDLTHLCLGSGDKDFSPFLKEAIKQGLKIIIVEGNIRSLSPELIELADLHPKTKKRMIYIFSPSTEEER